ncbi:MAG: hypothetical protein DLM62_14445 [Pseudonocardiales bacterium]|nr:MAG: hypothetical protein DLM62_14445 [Pseudonocardiales bacterium]
MNLIATGAALGPLVLVFQHGVGASLIGYTSTGFVQVYLPLTVDVTVSEVWGRTNAACGCAVHGNFSSKVAVDGTSPTDNSTSSWGRSDGGRRAPGTTISPCRYCMTCRQVASDVADAGISSPA